MDQNFSLSLSHSLLSRSSSFMPPLSADSFLSLLDSGSSLPVSCPFPLQVKSHGPLLQVTPARTHCCTIRPSFPTCSLKLQPKISAVVGSLSSHPAQPNTDGENPSPRQVLFFRMMVCNISLVFRRVCKLLLDCLPLPTHDISNIYPFPKPDTPSFSLSYQMPVLSNSHLSFLTHSACEYTHHLACSCPFSALLL